MKKLGLIFFTIGALGVLVGFAVAFGTGNEIYKFEVELDHDVTNPSFVEFLKRNTNRASVEEDFVFFSTRPFKLTQDMNPIQVSYKLKQVRSNISNIPFVAGKIRGIRAGSTVSLEGSNGQKIWVEDFLWGRHSSSATFERKTRNQILKTFEINQNESDDYVLRLKVNKNALVGIKNSLQLKVRANSAPFLVYMLIISVSAVFLVIGTIILAKLNKNSIKTKSKTAWG